MEATARTVVNRPLEAGWDYVSTVEHLGEWVDGVSDVRRDDDLAEGSRFSSQYAYRDRTFDVDYEVPAFEPPHRLDLAWVDGPFPFETSLRLAEVAGGTEVTSTRDAGSDSRATAVIFAVLGPVVRRLLRRELDAELDRLAACVATDGESAPEPAPSDA